MKRHRDVPISVPIRYVLGMVAGVERRGLDIAPLLATARISRQVLAEPRARVSLKQFSRFYLGVVTALDDEVLGLGATPIRRGAAEIICRAGSTGRNLQECAGIVAMVENIMWPDMAVRMVVTADEVQLVWRLRCPVPGDPALLYEMTLLTTLGILTWMAGEHVPVIRTDLPFPAPRHLFELRSLLPGQLHFNQPEARLCLAPLAASMPLRRQPSDISRFIRQAPGSFIESMLVRGLTSMRIRELLRDSLPTLPSLHEVALLLALSPRTLHRKLEQEGESFQSIKDSLRCDMAIHALTRTQTPIKQIADDLGFTDQATFHRAFATWTGRSPGTYRQAPEQKGKR